MESVKGHRHSATKFKCLGFNFRQFGNDCNKFNFRDFSKMKANKFILAQKHFTFSKNVLLLFANLFRASSKEASECEAKT